MTKADIDKVIAAVELLAPIGGPVAVLAEQLVEVGVAEAYALSAAGEITPEELAALKERAKLSDDRWDAIAGKITGQTDEPPKAA